MSNSSCFNLCLCYLRLLAFCTLFLFGSLVCAFWTLIAYFFRFSFVLDLCVNNTSINLGNNLIAAFEPKLRDIKCVQRMISSCKWNVQFVWRIPCQLFFSFGFSPARVSLYSIHSSCSLVISVSRHVEFSIGKHRIVCVWEHECIFHTWPFFFTPVSRSARVYTTRALNVVQYDITSCMLPPSLTLSLNCAIFCSFCTDFKIK